MKAKGRIILIGFRYLLPLLLTIFIAYSTNAQTVFFETYGFEPHFVPPGGEDGVKNIKTDYGAVGDGITDDTEAFLAWAAGGERTLFIPEGTYLISKQIRLGSGMKRVLWIGERRTTTIIKLKDNSQGFGNDVIHIPFIYFIAPGQQGEQNMQNFIQHLTIEIGTGNPGAVALNFHSNNTGGVYDVAVRASDPQNSRGQTGIGILDWGAGPGFLRFIEIEGFKQGIQVSADNHWTLEHIKVENCNTGIKAEESTSIRKVSLLNCDIGVNCSAPMALTDVVINTSSGGTDAISVSSPDVLIRNLKTSGYDMAINTDETSGDGVQTGPDVAHWVAESSQSLWTPDPGMDESLGLPVEESPVYQYAQSDAEWALATSTNEIQTAIDAGKTHIYLPRSTSLSGDIYLRNNVKQIMFLGQSAPYTNNPTYILQDGNVEAVIIEQNAGGILKQESTRTAVIRHSPLDYKTEPAGIGGKVFIESAVAGFSFTGVKAWLRDVDTEKGGPDVLNIKIDNSTVWILGHKTEDFATKISASNGGFCELLGGTYRQNWDQADFDGSGLNINDRPPLFLIDNAHASFAGVNTWGPNIAYDPVIREIRGSETRDLPRATEEGKIALYTGYTSVSPGPDLENVTGININPGNLTIEVGQTEMIVSTIIPITATNKQRIWSSSNESVATVDFSGFVTAMGEGNATITVKTDDGNFAADCEITVPAFVSLTGISLSPETTTINVEESFKLDVVFEPENPTNKLITWQSSEPGIATVNSEGTITGISPGTTVITASSDDGGFTSTSTITVNLPGSSGLFAYEGFDYPEGSLVDQDGGIGWTGPWTGEGNIFINSYDYTELETIGNHIGLENQTASRTLSQKLGEPGDQVWLGFVMHEGANSPSIFFNLLDGDDIKMSLLRGPYDQWGLNNDGTGDPDNLPWTNEKLSHHFWLFKLIFGSSSTSVTVWRDPDLTTQPETGGTTISLAEFSFDKIQMSASFPGGTAITSFDEIRIAGNFFNTRNNDAFIGVDGITLSPETKNMNAGETLQLIATVSPSDATNKNVLWSSEDQGIVTVDNQGKVTALGKGTTMVKAMTQEGGYNASSTITVTVPVTGMTIDQETASINVGESLQLIATVLPENASDTGIIWISSNTDIAAVDQNGLVEGLSAGEVTITAQSNEGSYEASCLIIVNSIIGIQSYEKSGFTIYPVPARKTVTLVFNESIAIMSPVLNITDLTGRILLKKELSEGLNRHIIDISSLREGIFIINVFEKDSRKVWGGYFVVE